MKRKRFMEEQIIFALRQADKERPWLSLDISQKRRAKAAFFG